MMQDNSQDIPDASKEEVSLTTGRTFYIHQQISMVMKTLFAKVSTAGSIQKVFARSNF